MNRKQRKSIAILIMGVFLLALVAGHSIQPVAMASEETPVEVSNHWEFLYAMIEADEGDTIVITGVIDIQAGTSYGGENHHLIFKRGNPEAKINIISAPDAYPAVLNNFTFDGDGIESTIPFLDVYHDAEFNDITMKNFTSTMSSGAVAVWDGEVTFNNCVFDNNKGLNGGHILVNQSAIVYLNNSILQNGQAATKGGAIFNASSVSTCIITSSIITGNEADDVGGAIFNNGIMNITGSKIYNNAAGQGGNDIANDEWGRLTLEDSLEDLIELFADDGIVPTGWVTDYVDEYDNPGNTQYLRLDYEIPPTEVILDPESLGVAGDGKITGLESGKYYKVTMDDDISYVKADGTLTTDETEAEPLLGTEIVGLTNGMTYRVEEYTPPVEEEPEEPGDDEEEPQDPIDDEEPPIDEPGDEEPNDEEQDETDQEEQEQTETPSESNVDQGSSQEQSSTSSSSSRSTTDIAEINPSSSSTVNNYITQQTPSNAPHSLPGAQSGANNPQAPVTQEQTIKIDAASLIPDSVKVQEDGNGITINVNVNVGSEGNGGTVQAQVQPDTGIPLVDVVKICLLFGIFICVFKRPERK